MARQTKSDKARAMIGIQFEGVEKEIAKLKESMKTLGPVIPNSMKGGFKQVETQVQRIKERLKDASDDDVFVDLQVSMSQVANEAKRIGTELQKAQGARGQIFDVGVTQRATVSLHKYSDALRQTTKAGVRTTLMSQNMLRVIQDSPFGMLGMANNIQMLAESFVFAKQKGSSYVETMKAGLKSLLMGPMAPAAIITVATIIVQKWDTIVEAGEVLGERLDGLTKSQREFNAAVREFEGEKFFTSILGGMNIDELEKGRQILLQMRDDIGLLTDERARLEEVTSKMGAAFGTGPVEERAGADPVLKAEKLMLENRIALFEKTALQLNLIDKEILETRAKNSAKQALGVESDDEKKLREQLEKEAKEAKALKKKLERLAWDRHLAAEKALDDAIKANEKELQALLDAGEKELAAELKIELDKLAQQKKLMQERAREVNRLAQAISMRLRAAIKEADAFERRSIMPLGFGATRELQRKHLRDAMETTRLADELKIASTKRAIAETEKLMIGADSVTLERLKAKHDALIAEQHGYEADSLLSQAEYEEKKADQTREFGNADIQHLQGILGSMASMYSSLGGMADQETEKGLRRHKEMMKKAAWASAVAASIGIFNSVAKSGTAGPLTYVAAAAAMGATMMTLSAQIQKIDQVGSTGSAAITGGRFTALTPEITAQRTAAFAAGQERLDATGAAGERTLVGQMSEDMKVLAEKVGDQRVIMDPNTSAEVERVGAAKNQRLIQTSD